MRSRRVWVLSTLVLTVLTSACTAGGPGSGVGPPTSLSSASVVATERIVPQDTSAEPSDAQLAPFSYTVAAVTVERLGASYRPGCPVAPDALRLLGLSYVGFDGAAAEGELVVAADLVQDIVAVFAELYRQRFPIRSMVTMEVGADDDASMAVDNTSAFNCRPITGGAGWSQHSYGVAIDLNPRENPYVSGQTVLPREGRDYLDRANPAPGMILAGDPVTTAFAAHGFAWGGYWTDPVDYQHFEA